jgi:hypothetical protein
MASLWLDPILTNIFYRTRTWFFFSTNPLGMKNKSFNSLIFPNMKKICSYNRALKFDYLFLYTMYIFCAWYIKIIRLRRNAVSALQNVQYLVFVTHRPPLIINDRYLNWYYFSYTCRQNNLRYKFFVRLHGDKTYNSFVCGNTT